MDASIIIIAHNEGNNLPRTIKSCLEASHGGEHEIIVVDDASTDGSSLEARRLGDSIRVVSNAERLGVSPCRVIGSEIATGEILIFLDAHCKPEPYALSLLIATVRRAKGRAIVTPAICKLDERTWVNQSAWTGNGYRIDLETFQTSWIGTERLKERQGLFESPAAIGCAMAVSRRLYDELGGFDPDMRIWGAEDADFSLTAWMMGHPVLHEPHAVIGHRFRDVSKQNDVPGPQALANDLRMARKHFSDAVWDEWVAGRRSQIDPASWDESWSLFEERRDSVERQRSYLLERRTHDEFWYARRFGLTWPARFVTDYSNENGSRSTSRGNVLAERSANSTGSVRLELDIGREQKGPLYVRRAKFAEDGDEQLLGYFEQVAAFLEGCSLADVRRLSVKSLVPRDGKASCSEQLALVAWESLQHALRGV